MQKRNWHQDAFFQYPLSPFETSCGNVDLPILYFDNSVVMAMYLVDADKAAAQMKDNRLEVARILGNKAIVVTAFYQYRDTAIAPYNEVGVAIAVLPKGTPAPAAPLMSLLRPLDKNPVGFNVIDLPVTTPAACAAGKEVWGYPKFVTPIGFELNGKQFKGSVQDPLSGEDMVVLDGRFGLAAPGPLLDLVLYSQHQGKLLRTLVNTRGGADMCFPGSSRLRISKTSKHPMAERLRQLGLDGAAPTLVCASHRLQLRLNQGAAVAQT